MEPGRFFLFALALCIVIIGISGKKRKLDNEDDDEYRRLKRLFWATTTTTTYWPPIWTQKSTYAPWYPTSGVCSSNPCAHGGICTPTGSSTFSCKCVGPWRGIYCGLADACYQSPCRNGGTCLNIGDDYWCKCTTDYYGTNCATQYSNNNNNNNNNNNGQNNCRPNICNTGQCVSLITTYYCRCPDNRYGTNCEKIYYKRNSLNERSLHQLLKQAKQGMNTRDQSDGSDNSQDSSSSESASSGESASNSTEQ
jgi:hypothetical protein